MGALLQPALSSSRHCFVSSFPRRAGLVGGAARKTARGMNPVAPFVLEVLEVRGGLGGFLLDVDMR
jgi:hypothetical protein